LSVVDKVYMKSVFISLREAKKLYTVSNFST